MVLTNLIILLFVYSVSAENPFQLQINNLSDLEKQWLESQKDIHFSLVSNQKPIAFKNDKGEIKGIIADYMIINPARHQGSHYKEASYVINLTRNICQRN